MSVQIHSCFVPNFIYTHTFHRTGYSSGNSLYLCSGGCWVRIFAQTPAVQVGDCLSLTSVYPDRIWGSTFVDRWPFPSISCPVQPINLSSWHSTLNTWSSRYRWRRKPNVDLPNMSLANRTMSSASCVWSFALCISLPCIPSLRVFPFSFIYLVFIFLPPSFPFLFLFSTSAHFRRCSNVPVNSSHSV
jgi:hypothetical protein